MASLGHVAVGMAAARIYRGKQPPSWSIAAAMVFWSALSLLPDLDVIGFRFGIRYGAPWGHRGATHSLAFAIGLGVLIGLCGAALKLPPLRTAVVAACVLASHGLLDTLTNGGLGCALLWPFENNRFFAPWNPIPVAPIGRAFFTPRGFAVAMHELLLFAPLVAYALWPRRQTV